MTRRQIFGIAAAVSLVLIAAIFLTATLTAAFKATAIRGTQESNTVKVDVQSETLKLVKDCVTPGGVCYERGQRQTASAVGALNDGAKISAAAAAACAAQPDIQQAPNVQSRTKLILRCMNGTLKDKP